MHAKSKKVKTITSDIPLEKDHEMERLREDIYRSDMEKLTLFTRMLRRNELFNKAKVTHK
jgi:hypothetical protein